MIRIGAVNGPDGVDLDVVEADMPSDTLRIPGLSELVVVLAGPMRPVGRRLTSLRSLGRVAISPILAKV